MSGPGIQLYDLLVSDSRRDSETTSRTRLQRASWTSDDHESPESSSVDVHRGTEATEVEHLVHDGQIASTSPHTIVEDHIVTDDARSHGEDQSKKPEATDHIARDHHIREQSTFLEVVGWWIPELIASAFSVASFVSMVALLLVYDRYAAERLNMPSGLTLNGLVALLATIGRVCLCAPVCSALLQEMWLYLARESRRPNPRSQLKDLELFTQASYGTVGSLLFLAHLSSTKQVACQLLTATQTDQMTDLSRLLDA